MSGSEDGRIVVWDICGEETKLQKAESNQTSHVVQVSEIDKLIFVIGLVSREALESSILIVIASACWIRRGVMTCRA